MNDKLVKGSSGAPLESAGVATMSSLSSPLESLRWRRRLFHTLFMPPPSS